MTENHFFEILKMAGAHKDKRINNVSSLRINKSVVEVNCVRGIVSKSCLAMLSKHIVALGDCPRVPPFSNHCKSRDVWCNNHVLGGVDELCNLSSRLKSFKLCFCCGILALHWWQR